MSSPFVGEVRLFAGNFPPLGWAFCDGQLLSIEDNPVLFILIGTTYGGDGQSTFALPDLRGRVPLHWGAGGGDSYVIGQSGGVEAVTLTAAHLPAHTHGLRASTQAATTGHDANDALGSSTKSKFYGPGPATVPMDPGAVSTTGAGQPHPNMAPFTAVNFIIALAGIFPSQN